MPNTAKHSPKKRHRTKTCSLCCEEPSEPLYHLAACHHESCRVCLRKWTEKTEAAGHLSCPSCPFCRVSMTEEDTQSILGRPFQPASHTAAQAMLEEVDDLTREWLEEQTTPCPHCGVHIQKERGTCDMMQCLCGFQFCHRCGSPGAQCNCTPHNHIFWDNMNDRLASRNNRQAARDAATGQLDLWKHIQWTRGRPIREGRACRVINNLLERDELDEPIARAPWLFCKKTDASIRMLDRIMNASNRRKERLQAREQLRKEAEEEPLGARWLFFSDQMGIWMLRQQHQRERRCTYNKTDGNDSLWKAEWDHKRAKIRKQMLRRAGFAQRPSLARSSSSFDSLKQYRNRFARR